MSQYLGDISAYALAVSQGYTGTEEEYAELMASYATVGQTAVTAAQTATTKASEAATSATTATNKASEATTAAQTATTKAGEASTSASTATSAKDTAVSASQTATTKASEATTAAATATNAASTATTAKDDAVSAKTAAQTAQTGAETAAASVSASAAQIATNTSDISELKEDLNATNTELVDIRVGSDGTIYPSAGAAVRNQIGNVKENIDKIETVLPQKSTSISLLDALTFIDSHYVDLSGNIYEHNDMKYAVATSVSVGDVIRFKGRKLSSAYCILLVTSDTTISDKFTVLDAVTDGYSDTDYIESEYTVSQSGYIIYQTRMSSANNYLIKDSVNYCVADSRVLIDTTNKLKNLENSIPAKRIFTDITDSLTFIEHYYVDRTGAIYNYNDVKYAVVGAVAKDDIFEYDARKVGSAYCILLAASSEPEANKFTVLDAVTDGYSYTDYISGRYTVPQDGYLIFQTRITYTRAYLKGSVQYYVFGESSLNGIKWVTIGDSLNEFNSSAENNWIKLMIAETAADNTNLAISGTGFYRGLSTNTNYITRIANIPSDTELITIAGSFNDLSSSPLPEIEVGTATDTGTSTLAGYMNAFFDELIANFPTISIGVYMTAPWQNYHYGVTRSDAYVNVLKEICMRRGIPFFDKPYFGNGLKPWNTANRTEYYTHADQTIDGVHPNDKGHIFIYQMLKPFVESLSPKSPLDV